MTAQSTGALVEGLYGDGIVAQRAAFSPEWVDRLGEDLEALFQEALARPGGAVDAVPTGTTWRSTRSACAGSSTWSPTPG
jgi:hypothetical protein